NFISPCRFVKRLLGIQSSRPRILLEYLVPIDVLIVLSTLFTYTLILTCHVPHHHSKYLTDIVLSPKLILNLL
ncbi:MAG: hypothetical protein QXV42_06265, partial [Ignisphaera sp.]